MGFKYKVNQNVDTVDGESGKIVMRDTGASGRQNKYAVQLDGNGTKKYFEEELQPE